MKKILLLIITFSLTFQIYSQNTIEYNFETGKFDNEQQKIHVNKNTRLIINNVNTFLWDVEIEIEQNSFNSEPPELFKQYILNEISTEELKEKAEKIQKTTQNEIDRAITAFISVVGELEDTKKLNKQLQLIVEMENVNWLIMDSLKIVYANKFLNTTDCSADCELLIYEECLDRLSAVNTAFDNIHNLDIDIDGEYYDLVKKVNDIKKEIDKTDYDKIFEDIIKLYDGINKNSFRVLSPIVYAEGDEIVFNVSITPKKDGLKFSNPKRTEIFPYHVSVWGGFKFDFSTGLFGSSLFDYKYAIQKDSIPNDTIMGYKILQEQQDKFNYGICALTHFTYRLPWSVNAGISFGVGIDNNKKVQYLLGGSFILGKKQRLIINGGWSFGTVDRLSNSLKEDYYYVEKPEIKLNSIMTNGVFLGISYNLTK